MRELPSEFGRKQKFRIVRHLSYPQASDLRPDGLVERSVDFDRVEVARNILKRVEAARLQPRINDSVPVLIRPPGRTTIECLGEGHGDNPFVLLLFAYQYTRTKGEMQGG